MAFIRKSNCIKLTIKLLLFLFLVLLTLALKILINSIWFPLSLKSPDSNLQIVAYKFSWRYQENNTAKHYFSYTTKMNDIYTKKTQNESRNLSVSKEIMMNISKGLQKTQYQYEYIINEPDKCKEHAPFLVLLITVERWQQEARQAIRNTWGKEDLLSGVKILRLFFLGKDSKLNTDAEKAILRESEEFHDIIQQNYLDTYENLTIKVLMGLTWITTYCPYALYVMKTDSDMFVNTEYLVNKLLKPDQAPKKKYFTGYLMLDCLPIRNLDSKWYVSPEEYPENSYPPFCSGTGYVLSGDLSHKIVNVSLSVRWIHLEDVFIGLCLHKIGVQPVAPPKDSDFNTWRVAFSDCAYHNIVTSHDMSPRNILHYWGRLQRNKHSCT